MERLLKTIKWTNLPIRPGFGSFMHPTEEKLKLIKQLGVNDIILNMYKNNLIDTNFDSLPLPGNNQWEYKDLLMLRNTIENEGIRFLALENMPFSFYDKIMMCQSGRKEQMKQYQTWALQEYRYWVMDGPQQVFGALQQHTLFVVERNP